MPLDPPHLDDRRFQDIVDEAKRMIPRFTPEWTNHNVSDPGVALIELFAWMSEMVLYRVNQVPERLYVHFLNLVGIEPFPPSVARTELTFWLSGPAADQVRIPAGTQVATADTEDPVIFSTSSEAVAVPAELSTALTRSAATGATLDVWEQLTLPGASVTVFASAPLVEGDAFYLGFTSPLAHQMVQLDIDAHAEGIGVDPRDPPLVWEVWTGEAWVPCVVESDTTGGLNQDGAVVLRVGPEAATLVLGGVSAHWLRVRMLRHTADRAGFQASPRVDAVTARTVGVTVAAEHSEVVPGDVLGRSTGVPAQVFDVPRAPVAARREGEHVVVTDHTGTHVWDEVADFSRSGAHDRHVQWDSGSGEVRFGPAVRHPDGAIRQHGAIPPDGAQVAVTSYRIGGGARGNVGARTLTALRSAVPFVSSVTNLRAASGGVDAETVEEARLRGPLALRTGQRAVTATDFEMLARQASVEVARARCLPAARTGSSAVRLLVVPQVRTAPGTHGIDDFALSSELFDAVATAIEERRTVGVAVELGTPYYQGVSIAALVRTLPGRPAEAVRQRISDALTELVHPLVGGPDGTGWEFGQDLTVGAVSQVVESVDGVLAVDEVQLFEYDLRNRKRVGEGRESVRLEENALFLAAEHRVVVR